MNAKFILSAMFILLFQLNGLFGQIELGVKAGLSSFSLSDNITSVIQGNQRIDWYVENAKYGHHFGVYTRLRVSAVYLEPALVFHSNSMSYTLEEYTNQQLIAKTIRNATYRHLDIPVLLGFKMGFFRIQGGPVGNFLINELSDLTRTSEFNQKLKDATFSWQAGLGVDVWRFRLDANYEGPLHAFGESITLGDRQLQLSRNPGRILLTLGFKL